VEGRGAEWAEEDVGPQAPEGRIVGRGEVEKRLEEAVEASSRAEDFPRLLDVEAVPEAVPDGPLRDERGCGGFRVRLHEKVVFVRPGPVEERGEEVQREEARPAVAAVRRQGSEVDEDPQAPPL
jgi:hypothetical protein